MSPLSNREPAEGYGRSCAESMTPSPASCEEYEMEPWYMPGPVIQATLFGCSRTLLPSFVTCQKCSSLELTSPGRSSDSDHCHALQP